MPRRIRCWLMPSAIFLLIVLVMCWRLWTPLGDRKEFGIDSQWAYWGELQFQLDSYKAGELPLWNPYDRGGYPFYSDPQGAILYPVTWALVGLGAVAGGAKYWLINLENIFHLWLAGLGMYAFLRRRGVRPAACYAGGLVLILSSPFIHHIDLNLNWSMAWAPWLLLAVDAWGEKPTPARATYAALAAGMSFLAGAMPTFWYGVVVAGPYALWSLWHHGRPGGRAYTRAALRSAGIGAAIFAALVAAQFLATSQLVHQTVRSTRDLDFVVGTQFGAYDLFGFFAPRVTRLNHYLGAIAIFGVAAAVSIRPSGRTLVLGAIAVFGILCAWGAEGTILPVVASIVPPFRLFRYAMRYTYVSMIPLGILAAEGLSALADLETPEARRRVGWVILAGGGLAVGVFAVGFVVQKGNDRIPYGMAFAAFLVGTWAAWQVAHSGTRRFLIAAVAVLGVDLLVGHMEAIERNMAPLVDTRHDGEVNGLPGVRGLEARVFDRAYLKFRPGIRLHLRDFGGYEGDPLALSRYAALRDAVEAQPRLLGHANVRWLLEEGPKTLNKSGADAAALKPVRPGVSELPEVAPAVMWVGRARLVDGEKQALGALLGGKPGSAAILERATLSADEQRQAESGTPDSAPVAGRITSFQRNRVTAEIDAPAAGVVVIHETWDPGWTATVDGQPAHLFPANEMFRGVFVPAGAHRIEMRYHASGFLWLSLLELVGLAAAAVVIVRERRRTVAA